MSPKLNRIAHINNTAGVPSILARFQGNSDVFVFDTLTQSMFGGHYINYNDPIKKRIFKSITLNKYKIWHYHYPYPGMKEELEERHGKNDHYLLKHYHGQDLRNIGLEDDFCLVSTPDLLSRAPHGEWLPNPLDLEFYSRFNGSIDNNVPIVIYYPAHKLQPTVPDNFSRVFESLISKKRCRIIPTFESKDKLRSWEDVIKVIYGADVVVGKINYDMGWFGKFELEGMALGKPVITYVSDELYKKYQPPIYRTSKETFEQDLEALLENPHLRKELGKRGMEYVKDVHDARKTVLNLEEYYRHVAG